MFSNNVNSDPLDISAGIVLDALEAINPEHTILLYNHCRDPENFPLGNGIIRQTLRTSPILPHGGEIPQVWRTIIIEVYETARPPATAPRLQ